MLESLDFELNEIFNNAHAHTNGDQQVALANTRIAIHGSSEASLVTRARDRSVGDTQDIERLLHDIREIGDFRFSTGPSTHAIARTMGVSVSTVKLDFNRVMRMLRVTERHTAAKRARGLGFLDHRKSHATP